MQFYDDMPNEEITECFLWGRLEPCLVYLRKADRAIVRRALELAIHAHEGQTRKSGEPFVSHPVEVTRILAELQAERVCDLHMISCILLRHDNLILACSKVPSCAGHVSCWTAS